MSIFLSGELGVVTPDGIQVATILPVTTVGEIGIATRRMRTATVKATKKSNLLVIKKVPLEQLLKSDSELLARIYRSLIEILAEKHRQQQHSHSRSPRCQGQRREAGEATAPACHSSDGPALAEGRHGSG